MTTSLIQIKYSTVTSAPSSLAQGELAYSELSGDLFIGNSTGAPTVIGGKHLVDRVGSLEALVATLQSDLASANGDLATAVANLNASIASVSAAVVAEINRATTAEAALQTAITTEAARAQSAESAEQARATAAEGALQTAINNEAARAQAAETAEQDRATAAEAALSATISSNAAAAQAAIDAVNARVDSDESRLTALETSTTSATALAAETARALAAEAALASSIAAEEARATAAENGLGGRVTDIEARLSGQAGAADVTVNGLTVKGNLVVQGTTTNINSEVTTVKDPTILLGSDTTSADGFDRGVEFKYFDSVSGTVKTGFMGLDHTSGEFKFLTDDGVLGTLNAKSMNVTEGIAGNGSSVLSGFVINGGTF